MSSSASSRSSGRARRPPAQYGNPVSSDQAYGSDDDEFEDPVVEEDEEDESWGRKKGGGEGEEEEGAEDEDEEDEDEAEFSDEDDEPKKKKGKEKMEKEKSKAATKTKSKAEPKKTARAPKEGKAKAAAPAKPKTLLPASAKTLAGKKGTKTEKDKPKVAPVIKPQPSKPKVKAAPKPKPAKGGDDEESKADDSDPAKGDSTDAAKEDVEMETADEDENLDEFTAPPAEQPRKVAGGKVPGKVSTIKKAPMVQLAKKPGVLPSVSKSAAKPSAKPLLIKAAKPAATVKANGKGKGKATSPLKAKRTSSSSDLPPGSDEEMGREEGSDEKEAEIAEEDDEPLTDMEDATTPAKRKRSAAGTDTPTPRKLAPAEKTTPEIRAGIVALFLETEYVNKVDWKSVAAACDMPESKVKRHWREVLGPDAKGYAKDGTMRPGRTNSKGGIEKEHRLKIWEAVCGAYDSAKWRELEEECGMSTTKLKRHFRDVLKNEIAKKISADK